MRYIYVNYGVKGRAQNMNMGVRPHGTPLAAPQQGGRACKWDRVWRRVHDYSRDYSQDYSQGFSQGFKGSSV
jgi:hypothetical protein